MKKLRLLVTPWCNRNCKGCCNNQWDLAALPVETDYTRYDQVILTGGEPMLEPLLVRQVIDGIRYQNPAATIIMYTAKTDIIALSHVLNYLDGLTITLHNQADWKPFLEFNHYMDMDQRFSKLLRLNVFRDAGCRYFEFDRFWQVKEGIEWIEDCPLPDDEVFKRV